MTTVESSKITAGLLGAGSIAAFHLRALQRLPYVRVIGIADLNEERAVALANKFRAPAAFSSLEQMLDHRPDVVHVLTPPEAHAASALEALAAGCHVYVEKPLATSVEDCDRIAAAAKEAGRAVCVGHSMLRDPFVLRQGIQRRRDAGAGTG